MIPKCITQVGANTKVLDPPLVTVFLIYLRNNSGEQNLFIFYESFSIRIYRPLGTIATSLPTGKPVSFLAAENYNMFQ